MDGQIVEFTGQIEELKLDHLKLFINDLGGQISVQKQLKFEDLGLAEVEKGIFQCLVCSKVIKRKDNAVTHFKKLHTDQVNGFFLFDLNNFKAKSVYHPKSETPSSGPDFGLVF